MAVTCAGCGAAHKPPSEFVGKKVRCPKCGLTFIVPAGPDAPTVSVAPADSWRTQPPRERIDMLPAVDDATAGTVPPLSGTPDPEGGATANMDAWDFLAPAQARDELGRLGSYRVLRVLGAGGMGIVFEAEDLTLKRKAAIKAMRPVMASSPSAKQRFLREAQTAAAIEHDHIVPIYQVGEDRGVPFIAMPLLKGEPLDVRLEREGAMPVAVVLRVGRQTAEGLAAAHAAGLIHRDIKPANLWLEAESGRVKILDFGLARSTADQQHLTQQGAIIGTPAYMAPEQATGQPVDTRCDLFSLGCVLYRMATGELPFKGNDTISTLLAVASTEPPPPHTVRRQVPRGLSDLIMKLLAKNPGQRPASARAVADALRSLEHAPAEAAPPLGTPPVKAKGSGVMPVEPPRPAQPKTVPPKAPAKTPPKPSPKTIAPKTTPASRTQTLRTGKKRRRTPAWMYWAIGGSVAGVALLGSVIAVIVAWPAAPDAGHVEQRSTTAPNVPVALEAPLVGGAQKVAEPAVTPPEKGPAGPRIVPGWGEVEDPEGDSRVTGEPSRLTIAIPGALRDLHPGGKRRSNAPRVLQEVNGDFIATVKVASAIHAFPGSRIGGAGSGEAFQSGGLLLWQDEQNFVRLERASREATGKVVPQYYLEAYSAGKVAMDSRTGRPVNGGGMTIPDNITHLRLERRGGKLYPSYSQDGGKSWPTAGFEPFTLDLPSRLRIGVAVVNNTTQPLTVEFADLQVTRPALAKADKPPAPKVKTQPPHAAIPWRDVQQITSAHIYQTGISHDGKYFFGAGDSGPDGIVRIFEVAAGREIQRLGLGYAVWFTNAAFVPGGKYLVAGYSKLKDAVLWDIATGRAVRRYIGHTQVGVEVAVSPNGKRLLTWGEDRTVRLWDIATGRPLHRLQGHTDKASGVFSPDGTRVLTFGGDKTMCLWETESGKLLRRFSGHTAPCHGYYSPGGKEILSFGRDLTIRLWDAATGQEIRRLEGGIVKEGARGFIAGGRQVAAYCEDKKYRIWDTADGKIVQEIDLAGAGESRNTITASPDGRLALVAAADRSVRVYELSTGRELQRYAPCPAARSFSFTPDGAWAVAGSFRQGLYVFRLPAAPSAKR